MTADAIIRIKIDANTGEARVIKRDLDQLGKSGDRVSNSSDKMTRSFGLLRGAMVALGGALSIQQFSKLADTITNINTKLGNVTDSTQQFDRAFNSLFEVAQKTGTEFTATVDTFNRLNTALPESISQTRDLTKTVELLNKGFAASGTEAAAARGAITQLTQGLASDFQASAQEINSLIDAAPLLAKVIAEELGGNAAVDLKKFAQEGKLTAESFLDALEAAEKSINSFKIPPTIERAVIRLKNEFLLFASGSDTLETASRKLAEAINVVAANLDTVVSVVKILAYSAVPALSVAIGTGLVNAVKALTVAMAANPLMAGALVLTGTIAAIVEFKDEIKLTKDGVVTLGGVFETVFDRIAEKARSTFEKISNFMDPLINKLSAFNGFFEKAGLAINQVANNFEKTFLDPSLSSIINETRRRQELLNAVNDNAGSSVDTSIDDIIKGNDLLQVLTGGNGSSPPPPPKTTSDADKPFKEVNERLKTATAESKKLTKELDVKMPDAVDNLSNQIERDLTGSFKDAFTESGFSFDKLMSGMQGSFSGFMSGITSQAARPIMLNLVAGVTGAAGFAGSANAAGIGGGSGGGFGGMGNLLSMGKNLLGGLNTPIFGAGSMIGGGINSIGSALGMNNASFIGPMMPGTSNLASAFTPGAGLAGFGGNMLANAIFGGDRGIGASIGGVAGGVGGTALGASIGAIGGPIGALAGGFIGNAIGGLFGGGKPSDKWQRGSINLSTLNSSTKGFTGDKFSQKNADAIKNLLDQVKDLSNMLKASGGELEGGLYIEVGNRDGLRLTESGKSKRNFGYNNEAFVKAINDAVIGSASGLSDNLTTALGNTDTGSIKAIAETIQFVDLIEGFGAETVPPLTAALDQLSASFEGLKTKAVDLGLPVEKITESYEKQREAIVSGALAPLQNFLDSQALSRNSSLSPGDRLSFARSQFDENLSAIQGGDLSNLGNITGQASQLLNIGRDVFASGEGFSSLESFVRQSITGIAGDLGAPGGLENEIGREITLSNAKQTSILEQQNLIIQEQAAELRKLRKAMERVGNFMVAS